MQPYTLHSDPAEMPPADPQPYGAAVHSGRRLNELTYVVFDTETTGLNPNQDRVVELAAVRMNYAGEHLAIFQALIHIDEMPIPEGAAAVHHITTEMLADALAEWTALDAFEAFLGTPMQNGRTVLAAHNAPFDIGMLQGIARRSESRLSPLSVLDTAALARHSIHWSPDHRLETLAAACQLETTLGGGAHHRALYDVGITAALLRRILSDYAPEQQLRELKGKSGGRSPLTGPFLRLDRPIPSRR